ncbi:hypothetical protein E1176_02515 [Fulvivirga sp. RKSG066]|uniref:hypothetical protein n=1 Tax=Fulvivirga aurantia TaxID=2529383 RepID=UPI0012BB8A42|nr:hypothetical protein [Fulvivirga aurantia]MTI19885.1 hypothetical protein [Fulvivirga aurantia]
MQLTEITSEDIIFGSYKLTEESVEYLNSEGYKKTCSLQLYESGEFKLTNAPDFMFDPFGRNTGNTLTRTGDWSTSCAKSYDCMIDLMGITVVPLSRKLNGPIAILITIGEGDSCNGIVFERIE